MSYNSLKIKDGDGNSKTLAVVSSSEGFYPVHIIDPNYTVTVKSLETDRSWITGTVVVNNFPAVQTVTASLSNRIGITGSVTFNNTEIYEQKSYAASISEIISSSFMWNTAASGTFKLADIDTSRKELIIFNPGPQTLYIKLSTTSKTDASKHGFTLINTSSAPSAYNFVVYPSGTYFSSEPSRVLYHGGYFISSSVTGSVVATSIT